MGWRSRKVSAIPWIQCTQVVRARLGLMEPMRHLQHELQGRAVLRQSLPQIRHTAPRDSWQKLISRRERAKISSQALLRKATQLVLRGRREGRNQSWRKKWVLPGNRP